MACAAVSNEEQQSIADLAEFFRESLHDVRVVLIVQCADSQPEDEGAPGLERPSEEIGPIFELTSRTQYLAARLIRDAGTVRKGSRHGGSRHARNAGDVLRGCGLSM